MLLHNIVFRPLSSILLFVAPVAVPALKTCANNKTRARWCKDELKTIRENANLSTSKHLGDIKSRETTFEGIRAVQEAAAHRQLLFGTWRSAPASLPCSFLYLATAFVVLHGAHGQLGGGQLFELQ